MKRNLPKILVVAVALFLVFPVTTFATGLSITPTGSDIISGERGDTQAKVFYQEVYNGPDSYTTLYQILNVYFDPAYDNYDYANPPSVLPAPDRIGHLDLLLDIMAIDPMDYEFASTDPTITVDTFMQIGGFIEFNFTPGIGQDEYSGVFSITSPYVIGANDTVSATFIDTSESIDEEVSFALTVGGGSPGTPQAPEPGTLMLLGGALLGFAVLRHQKRD